MSNDNLWYCLADDGLLWILGEHDSFDSADDTAEKMGLNIIWLIDPDGAQSWKELLTGTEPKNA